MEKELNQPAVDSLYKDLVKEGLFEDGQLENFKNDLRKNPDSLYKDLVKEGLFEDGQLDFFKKDLFLTPITVTPTIPAVPVKTNEQILADITAPTQTALMKRQQQVPDEQDAYEINRQNIIEQNKIIEQDAKEAEDNFVRHRGRPLGEGERLEYEFAPIPVPPDRRTPPTSVFDAQKAAYEKERQRIINLNKQQLAGGLQPLPVPQPYPEAKPTDTVEEAYKQSKEALQNKSGFKLDWLYDAGKAQKRMKEAEDAEKQLDWLYGKYKKAQNIPITPNLLASSDRQKQIDDALKELNTFHTTIGAKVKEAKEQSETEKIITQAKNEATQGDFLHGTPETIENNLIKKADPIITERLQNKAQNKLGIGSAELIPQMLHNLVYDDPQTYQLLLQEKEYFDAIKTAEDSKDDNAYQKAITDIQAFYQSKNINPETGVWYEAMSKYAPQAKSIYDGLASPIETSEAYQSLSPQGKVAASYLALHNKKLALEKELGYDENSWNFYNPFSDKSAEKYGAYKQVLRDLDDLAPLAAFIPSYNPTKENTGILGRGLRGALGINFVDVATPDYQKVQKVVEEMQKAGVDIESLPSITKYLADGKSWGGYFSREFPSMLGTSLGIGAPMLISGFGVGAISRGAQLLAKYALSGQSQLRTIVALRRADMIYKSPELLDIYFRGNKAAAVFSKIGIQGAKYWAGSFAASPEARGELTFTGGAAGESALQALGGLGGGLSKLIGPTAMKFLAGIGRSKALGPLGEGAKTVVRAFGRGQGEYFEEMAQTMSQFNDLVEKEGESFWDLMKHEFGTLDQNLKFYLSTALMGTFMGGFSDGGGINRAKIKAYQDIRKNVYNSLTPQQKVKADKLLANMAGGTAKVLQTTTTMPPAEAIKFTQLTKIKATLEQKVAEEQAKLEQAVASGDEEAIRSQAEVVIENKKQLEAATQKVVDSEESNREKKVKERQDEALALENEHEKNQQIFDYEKKQKQKAIEAIDNNIVAKQDEIKAAGEKKVGEQLSEAKLAKIDKLKKEVEALKKAKDKAVKNNKDWEDVEKAKLDTEGDELNRMQEELNNISIEQDNEKLKEDAKETIRLEGERELGDDENVPTGNEIRWDMQTGKAYTNAPLPTTPPKAAPKANSGVGGEAESKKRVQSKEEFDKISGVKTTLVGSTARGEAKESSDIDVVLEGMPHQNKDRLNSEERQENSNYAYDTLKHLAENGTLTEFELLPNGFGLSFKFNGHTFQVVPNPKAPKQALKEQPKADSVGVGGDVIAKINAEKEKALSEIRGKVDNIPNWKELGFKHDFSNMLEISSSIESLQERYKKEPSEGLLKALNTLIEFYNEVNKSITEQKKNINEEYDAKIKAVEQSQPATAPTSPPIETAQKPITEPIVPPAPTKAEKPAKTLKELENELKGAEINLSQLRRGQGESRSGMVTPQREAENARRAVKIKETQDRIADLKSQIETLKQEKAPKVETKPATQPTTTEFTSVEDFNNSGYELPSGLKDRGVVEVKSLGNNRFDLKLKDGNVIKDVLIHKAIKTETTETIDNKSILGESEKVQVSYGGKVKEVDTDFKQAAQRVRDNLQTGEVGYVKMPNGETYEISTANKTAKLLPKEQPKEGVGVAGDVDLTEDEKNEATAKGIGIKDIVRTKDIFKNPYQEIGNSGGVKTKETKDIQSEIKDAKNNGNEERINVSEIYPSQKVLHKENMTSVRDDRNAPSRKPVILRKTDDGFVVLDGHHRIAMAIMRGDKDINAIISKAVEQSTKETEEGSVVGGDNPALKDVESTAKALEEVAKSGKEIKIPYTGEFADGQKYPVVLSKPDEYTDFSGTKRSGFKGLGNSQIPYEVVAEDYHKAKAQGIENDFTKAVEQLLNKQQENETAENITEESNNNLFADTGLDVTPTTEAEVSNQEATIERVEGDISTEEAKLNINTQNVNTDELIVAPEIFQYKQTETAKTEDFEKTGVTKGEKLEGDWNPNLAGTIGVWVDKNNELGGGKNKVYVVDGHHRVAFARENNVKKLNVFYIQAENAKEARLTGAMANIASGRGTEIDAAKVFRDATEEQLKGFKPKSDIGRKGLALSKLTDELFRMVVDEKLGTSKALILSKLDKAAQNGFYNDYLQEDKTKRKTKSELTLAELETLAKKYNDGFTVTAKTGGMFGEVFEASANLVEEAKIETAIKQALSEDAKILGLVNKEKNKEILARAGNIISTETNADLAEKSRKATVLFEAFGNTPSAQAIIREAARALKSADKDTALKNTIIKNAIEAVKKAIIEEEAQAFGRPSPLQQAESTAEKANKKWLNALLNILQKAFPNINIVTDTAVIDSVLEKLGLKDKPLMQMTLSDGQKVTVKALPEGLSIVNGFYSPIEKNLRESKVANQSATKWLSQLGKGDEMTYTGLKEFLEGKRPDEQVKKQEILDFLKDNRIEIVEVVKVEGIGVTAKERFHTETLELRGEKENYKEVLITMPSKETAEQRQKRVDDIDKRSEDLQNKIDILYKQRKDGSKEYKDLVNENEQLLQERRKILYNREDNTFRSAHYPEPNILVHLRMDTRTDTDGNKVVFLEEVQSDWAQEGKKAGFKTNTLPNGYEVVMVSGGENIGRYWVKETKTGFGMNSGIRGNIPGTSVPQYFSTPQLAIDDAVGNINLTKNSPAPFVTETPQWVKLALKVALQHAVKEGATKIAWTTGEQQNDRYDLSKKVERIDVEKVDEVPNLFFVDIKMPDGTEHNLEVENGKVRGKERGVDSGFEGKPLEDIIGKDIAERILNGGSQTIEGDDLKVGGKGMIGFYGNPKENKLGIIGEVAKKLFKQEPKTTKIELGVDEEQLQSQLREQERANQFENISIDDAPKKYSTQHSIDITPEMKAEVEQGLPLFQRKPFGGNSGYVGFSMSKRAEKAYEEGKLNYSRLPAWAKRMVDAGMATTDEWHHTSSYGNETPFYNVGQFDSLTDAEKTELGIDDWSDIESFNDVPKKAIKIFDTKTKAELKNKSNVKETRKGYVEKAQKELNDFNSKFKSFSRQSKSPEHSIVQSSEMNGKFGWFEATTKYSLPEYHSGIDYETAENKSKAIELNKKLSDAKNKPIYEIELSRRGFDSGEIAALRNLGIIDSEIMPESFYQTAERNKDIIKAQLKEISALPKRTDIFSPTFRPNDSYLTDEEKQAKQDRHSEVSKSDQSSYSRFEDHKEVDRIYNNLESERYRKAKEQFSNSEEAKQQEAKFNKDKEKAQKLAENLNSLFETQEEQTPLFQEIKDKEGNPLGFVYEGKVYIDPRLAGKDTPIHEFGHIWTLWVKQTNNALYKQGINLLKNTELGQKYVNAVRANPAYSKLSDEQVYEEALAQLIGERGADVFEAKGKKEDITWQNNPLNKWLKEMWRRLALAFNRDIKGKKIAPQELANMKLEDFVKRAGKELLGEKALSKITSEEVADLQKGTTQFSENAGFVTRDGKPIGFDYDTDKVARERFDFSKLKKIGSGSDRDVYDLGDGKVLKVAKTARGLQQNIYEGDAYLSGIVPEVFERGLNYVVAENVPSAKSADVVTTYDYDGNETGKSTVGEMLKEFSKFSQKEMDNHDGKLQDALAKYGFQDIMSYNVLWGDFTAKRNWGYKNGQAVHTDAGTFGGVQMIDDYKGKKNLDDADFRDIYNKSKELKKQFGDTDKNTMYSILGQFVGENAKLAQEVMDDLETARAMEKAGKDAKTIRLATSWEKGKDGKWRYEIDDYMDAVSDWFGLSGLKEGTQTISLGAIVSSELRKLYPELKNISVEIIIDKNAKPRGAYNTAQINNQSKTKNIFVTSNNLGTAQSVLIHEIQHAIQEIEGFAKGGSPSQFKNTPLPKKLKDKHLKWFLNASILQNKLKGKGFKTPDNPLTLVNFESNTVKKFIDENQELKQEYDAVISESKQFDEYLTKEQKYRRLAGEVEARNAQTRANMTPEERKATMISETEDVAREDQIVLMNAMGVQESQTPLMQAGQVKQAAFAKKQGKIDANTFYEVFEAGVIDASAANELNNLLQTEGVKVKYDTATKDIVIEESKEIDDLIADIKASPSTEKTLKLIAKIDAIQQKLLDYVEEGVAVSVDDMDVDSAKGHSIRAASLIYARRVQQHLQEKMYNLGDSLINKNKNAGSILSGADFTTKHSSDPNQTRSEMAQNIKAEIGDNIRNESIKNIIANLYATANRQNAVINEVELKIIIMGSAAARVLNAMKKLYSGNIVARSEHTLKQTIEDLNKPIVNDVDDVVDAVGDVLDEAIAEIEDNEEISKITTQIATEEAGSPTQKPKPQGTLTDVELEDIRTSGHDIESTITAILPEGDYDLFKGDGYTQEEIDKDWRLSLMFEILKLSDKIFSNTMPALLDSNNVQKIIQEGDADLRNAILNNNNLTDTEKENAISALEALQDRYKALEASELLSDEEFEVQAELLTKGFKVPIVWDSDKFDQAKEDFEKEGFKIRDDAAAFVFRGKVYLDKSKARKDTLLEEFTHVYTEWAKQSNIPFYKRGIALIKGSEYYQKAKTEQPNAPESAILDEALGKYIRDKGSAILDKKIAENKKEQGLWNWVRELYKNVADKFNRLFGKGKLTGEQVANMSLDDLANYAAEQILGGKKIADAKDFDIAEDHPLYQVAKLSRTLSKSLTELGYINANGKINIKQLIADSTDTTRSVGIQIYDKIANASGNAVRNRHLARVVKAEYERALIERQIETAQKIVAGVKEKSLLRFGLKGYYPKGKTTVLKKDLERMLEKLNLAMSVGATNRALQQAVMDTLAKDLGGVRLLRREWTEFYELKKAAEKAPTNSAIQDYAILQMTNFIAAKLPQAAVKHYMASMYSNILGGTQTIMTQAIGANVFSKAIPMLFKNLGKALYSGREINWQSASRAFNNMIATWRTGLPYRSTAVKSAVANDMLGGSDPLESPEYLLYGSKYFSGGKLGRMLGARAQKALDAFVKTLVDDDSAIDSTYNNLIEDEKAKGTKITRGVRSAKYAEANTIVFGDKAKVIARSANLRNMIAQIRGGKKKLEIGEPSATINAIQNAKIEEHIRNNKGVAPTDAEKSKYLAEAGAKIAGFEDELITLDEAKEIAKAEMEYMGTLPADKGGLRGIYENTKDNYVYIRALEIQRHHNLSLDAREASDLSTAMQTYKTNMGGKISFGSAGELLADLLQGNLSKGNQEKLAKFFPKEIYPFLEKLATILGKNWFTGAFPFVRTVMRIVDNGAFYVPVLGYLYAHTNSAKADKYLIEAQKLEDDGAIQKAKEMRQLAKNYKASSKYLYELHTASLPITLALAGLFYKMLAESDDDDCPIITGYSRSAGKSNLPCKENSLNFPKSMGGMSMPLWGFGDFGTYIRTVGLIVEIIRKKETKEIEDVKKNANLQKILTPEEMDAVRDDKYGIDIEDVAFMMAHSLLAASLDRSALQSFNETIHRLERGEWTKLALSPIGTLTYAVTPFKRIANDIGSALTGKQLDADTFTEELIKGTPILNYALLEGKKDIIGNKLEAQYMWSSIPDKKKKEWVVNELRLPIANPNIDKMIFYHSKKETKTNLPMPYDKLFKSGKSGIFYGRLSSEGRDKYTETFEGIFNNKFNAYYSKDKGEVEKRINNSNLSEEDKKNTILKLHRDKITSIAESAKKETAKYLQITVDTK